MRNTDAMEAAAKRPDRVLIGILSAIALLVVVALAVVFARGEPSPMDESTPAGVVQRFSTAVIRGDTATANTYLTDAARSACTGYPADVPVPSQVVLVSTTERGTTAVVKVSITMSGSAGPFGQAEYKMEDRFSLSKVNGKWLVNTAPYQFLPCTGSPVKQ